jgi:RNA polymerase sigma-70 factor (ECF subfamily)
MNDSDAFLEELWPHVDGLYAFARRFGLDADDLVQETLYHALRARAGYRAGSNARAWLYRILHNLAVSQHRARARDRRLEARLSMEPVAAAERVEAGDQEERIAAVRRGLDGLSPADRRVIDLVDVAGLSYREAAQALGCPIGTVMSRLHRARRRLERTVMAPAGPEPERRATQRAGFESASAGAAP